MKLSLSECDEDEQSRIKDLCALQSDPAAVRLAEGQGVGSCVVMAQQPKKLIIDTDPGIGGTCRSLPLPVLQISLEISHASVEVICAIADDSMAICAAFNSPEVDVVGLTTIFGNVKTPTATANAFILLKLAGKEQARAELHW